MDRHILPAHCGCTSYCTGEVGHAQVLDKQAAAIGHFMEKPLGAQGLSTALVGAHLCSSKRKPVKGPCPRKLKSSTSVNIQQCELVCSVVKTSEPLYEAAALTDDEQHLARESARETKTLDAHLVINQACLRGRAPRWGWYRHRAVHLHVIVQQQPRETRDIVRSRPSDRARNIVRL